MQTLDADAVRLWCATGLAALRRHEQEINRLNVYPVPDGDTGTNLVLTLAAAERALAGSAAVDSAGEALRRAARQALLDARGNSGVILAQFLRGMADRLPPPDPVDGPALAAALDTAVKEAYGAVAEPVEGTTF